MDAVHTLPVRCVGGTFGGMGWGGDVKGILEVTGGVLLWDKEGVEVPEGGFDKGVCGHFLETHFEEDVAEFFAHFHEGMQGADFRWYSHCVEIVRFDGCCFPGAAFTG
jgi:hypothetical protein